MTLKTTNATLIFATSKNHSNVTEAIWLFLLGNTNIFAKLIQYMSRQIDSVTHGAEQLSSFYEGRTGTVSSNFTAPACVLQL